MFDIGFTELLMVGIIALVVLGPERLPQAARTVGLWIGKAKRGFNAVKTEIDRELKLQELEQQVEEQKQKLEQALPLEDLKKDLSVDLNAAQAEVESLANSAKLSAEHQTIAPPPEKPAPSAISDDQK